MSNSNRKRLIVVVTCLLVSTIIVGSGIKIFLLPSQGPLLTTNPIQVQVPKVTAVPPKKLELTKESDFKWKTSSLEETDEWIMDETETANVSLDIEKRTWRVKNKEKAMEIVTPAIWAASLKSGNVIIVPENFSLVMVDKGGEVTELLEPYTVGGRVIPTSDGRRLAVCSGLVFPASDMVGATGIAVYDMVTNEYTELISNDQQHVVNLGWMDDKILFIEVGLIPQLELKLVSLNGIVSKYHTFTDVGLLYDSPRRSLDGKYIATFRKEGSVGVYDLDTKESQIIENVERYRWVKQGLEVFQNGAWRLYKIQ